MPRTLLLTTGTSIANGTAALSSYQKKSTTWEETAADLREQARERLKVFDMASEDGRVKASAEINILHRLPVRPDDEVILFSTDTADGRCCSELLAEVVRDILGVSSVTVERIEGLQVRDAEKLRKVGLTNLTRRLIHYLDDPQRRYGGGCMLCPNGGFKGIVPFMTVLGMIYRAPVVYVFEFAETMIRLPPLPVGFAPDLLERALPALRWASQEGVFAPEPFFRLVSGFHSEEQDLFESFLEIAEDSGGAGLASLSPLASALAEKEGSGEACLALSDQARKSVEALCGDDRLHVEAHLRKLTSPLWRSQHLDTKYSNDLEFYPRGHHPWRFAGFSEGGIFHLCWFARHDEYERRLPLDSSQRSAFASAEFEEFIVPLQEAQKFSEDDPDRDLTWQTVREQRDRARKEAESLRTEAGSLRAEVTRLRGENQKALTSLAELQRQLKRKPKKKPEAEPRDLSPKQDLQGKTLAVRCEGTRKQSMVFSAVEQPEAPQILVPARDVSDIHAGEVIQVEVTGFDGNFFQARPASDKSVWSS